MTRTLAMPSDIFPGLFSALQTSGALEDMKALADAVPRAEPSMIEALFRDEAPADPPALRAFVARWFTLPEPPVPFAPAPGATLAGHIDRLWDHLMRPRGRQGSAPSLIALDHAYLIPGGMFRECYYWDSYFTIIGLGPERAALGRECVDALAEQIDRFGHVPNGNRTYYLSRSQPPTFFASVSTLAPETPERAWSAYLPQLCAEHRYWMRGAQMLAAPGAEACVIRLPDGALLNRYWDSLDRPRDECMWGRDVAIAAASGRPVEQVYRDIRAGCASGWDFSSRWFGDRATMETIKASAIIPADLNALLYGLETAIRDGAHYAGDFALAKRFEKQAAARRAAMDRWLWNPGLGIFDDVDADTLEQRGAISAACAVPLFTGCASYEQAWATAARIEQSLLAPGGLLATDLATGEQWDAPNGWAPSQWMAILGLERYGIDDLAQEIARRWLATVSRVFAETGRILEKYDVMRAAPGGGGEYPLQDGFGWTNGVTGALLFRQAPGEEIRDTRYAISADYESYQGFDMSLDRGRVGRIQAPDALDLGRERVE